MVHVKGITSGEIKRRERVNRLVEIALETFPEGKTMNLRKEEEYSLHFYPHGGPNSIYISLWAGNDLQIKDPSLLDDAIKLAQAYEKAEKKPYFWGLVNFGPTFTVKKDYDEAVQYKNA